MLVVSRCLCPELPGTVGDRIDEFQSLNIKCAVSMTWMLASESLFPSQVSWQWCLLFVWDENISRLGQTPQWGHYSSVFDGGDSDFHPSTDRGFDGYTVVPTKHYALHAPSDRRLRWVLSPVSIEPTPKFLNMTIPFVWPSLAWDFASKFSGFDNGHDPKQVPMWKDLEGERPDGVLWLALHTRPIETIFSRKSFNSGFSSSEILGLEKTTSKGRNSRG